MFTSSISLRGLTQKRTFSDRTDVVDQRRVGRIRGHSASVAEYSQRGAVVHELELGRDVRGGGPPPHGRVPRILIRQPLGDADDRQYDDENELPFHGHISL